MARIKLTKNLHLDEYMPLDIYKKYGAKCVRLIDQRVVMIDQALRDQFGPIYINIPGFQYRGFRPFSYYMKRGKPFSQSQHKYGRASDKHFGNISVDEVCLNILKNESKWLALGLTTVENTAFTHRDKSKLGWLHTDCRYPEPTHDGMIRIVNP